MKKTAAGDMIMQHCWDDDRPYNSYAGYFRRLFGHRVQKLSVDAGFTCPNRDGTITRQGCTFCINGAFTPSYCTPDKSIARQIDEGIEFHRRRYRKAQSYLVYFQSYSNTYAPVEHLQQVYAQALAHPDVAGIVIGTRPDCIDDPKLDLLEQLAQKHYVAVEYGIESVSDRTLQAINRGHDFAAARQAVEMTAARGIAVGAHFIIGFPDEDDRFIVDSVRTINTLPLTTVKFHQLQVFKGTAMADDYRLHPERYPFRTPDQYIDLVIGMLRRLRGDIVVERFASEAPPRYHYGRNWGLLRNETLWAMLEARMREQGVEQGDLL